MPSAVLPQRQPYSDWLEPTAKTAGVPGAGGASGASVTTEPFTDVDMFCAVALTTPSALVVTVETYFVELLPPSSQPQPLGPGLPTRHFDKAR